MKKLVTLLGANENGTLLMDQVYEFEKRLANVCLAFYSSIIFCFRTTSKTRSFCIPFQDFDLQRAILIYCFRFQGLVFLKTGI